MPSVAQALTSSIAAALGRLSETPSDLVFPDLPRRVVKVLLSQHRGGDGIIRPKMTQEELAHQAVGIPAKRQRRVGRFVRRTLIEVHDRAAANSRSCIRIASKWNQGSRWCGPSCLPSGEAWAGLK